MVPFMFEANFLLKNPMDKEEKSRPKMNLKDSTPAPCSLPRWSLSVWQREVKMEVDFKDDLMDSIQNPYCLLIILAADVPSSATVVSF